MVEDGAVDAVYEVKVEFDLLGRVLCAPGIVDCMLSKFLSHEKI